MKKRLLTISLFMFLISIAAASATLEFNGTVKDENGNNLANATVNVTLYEQGSMNAYGYNATKTNGSGWFNLTLSSGAYTYKPVVTANTSGDFINWRSKALPSISAQEVPLLGGMTFYLSEAGTINISAINSSDARIGFKYQIKDQALGYPIAEEFSSTVTNAIITVPRNRNYSIMIYPNESMPISFDWNNFSSSDSYNLTNDANRSNYDASTYTLSKEFNATVTMPWVSGYINYTNISGWDELRIVPYLVEPGNMIHATYGDMPLNMSAFNGTQGDSYNLTNGFYNISLPATTETTTLILYASAKNGSSYYGGFRNISLDYGQENTGLNFTSTYMYGLFGEPENISMDIMDGGKFNVPTKKQNISLVNENGVLLSNTSAHVEAVMDYTSLGVMEFTWMADISSTGSASFNLPLLNSTGIKELNVFANGGDGSGGQYAPKRTSLKVTDIKDVTNITMGMFNPGDIDEELNDNDISISLLFSNATCDMPNPPSVCNVSSTQTMEDFNPMQAVFGGGKLSFRMGTGNISVHYVNVDLLASGPPDASFDSNVTESTSSSSFSSALRFGSNGPTIYDYVLISLPYTEYSATQSGLNESKDINVSIPYFYGEDWTTPIWNASANGTSASALAGNYSHYSAKQSEWQELLNVTTCATNASSEHFNKTKPCYVDTTNNKIWIRLPHFSGTQPNVAGSNVVVTTDDSSDDTTDDTSDDTTSTSPGSTTPSNVHKIAKVNAGEEETLEINDDDTGIEELMFEVNQVAAAIKFEIISHDEMPESVDGSDEIAEEELYKYFEIKTTNLPSDNIRTAKIKFKVDAEWLEDNGLEPEEVKLWRYIGRWQGLETEVVSESDSEVVYEASTPGFSVFAVKVDKMAAEEEQEVEEETEPAIVDEEPVEEVEEETGSTLLLVLVIILAVLIVGVLLYTKKDWIKEKLQKKTQLK